ncbi:MAG TPA: V-type ATPase 116kDa subunit family protein [Spirochaetia bacterium]|nr:V-type ATPase 116kDa subunit family protein [Spirochaetia bacterium]
MLTERMRKVELHLLHRDIDAVLEYLGNSKCMQIDPATIRAAELAEGEEEVVQARQIAVARGLTELGTFLSGPSIGENRGISGTAEMADAADLERAGELLSLGNTLIERHRNVEQHLKALRGTRDEVSAFARLAVPFSEIENLTFLSIRIGRLPTDKVAEVEQKLGGRGVLVPLSAGDRILAAASRKGRFALDGELKSAGFQETGTPANMTGVPRDIVIALERDLEKAEREFAEVEQLRLSFKATYGELLHALLRRFAVAAQINEVKRGLSTSKTVYRLAGWVPQSLVRTMLKDLEACTQERIAIRVYTPGELGSVRDGAEKVPVRLKHSGLVRSFERMVFSYGAPLYGTIDPTPIVAFLFILLFAIMFGDVGQGLVGVAAGIIFIHGKRILGADRWSRWRHFGPIFIAVGTAVMITGFLYGSVFSEETMLIPITRTLSTWIFGEPRDRFISLLPEGGLDRIFLFFGFTLSLGIIINSIGLVINIYNQLRLRRYQQAFLTKTGLAGAMFFWYAIFVGVRMILGGTFTGIDIALLFVPLTLLFCAEPIYRIVNRERPIFHDGPLSFFVAGFVEILESVSYYLSNSLSFLRVAAFALSHTVLSLIVFKIVELLHGMPADVVFQTLVIIIGNLLIIFLEGLIVSIQVIRLQYYEFFSKFFTETGEEFHPFALRSGV